jgi:hypothetical protein
MLERVITGGQIGVDQAAWRAAKAAGIPTGGAMPQGFLTEERPRPDFAAEFGAHELERPGYPARNEANILASDGTLWFGDPTSPWGKLMLEWCRKARKSVLIVSAEGGHPGPARVARWILNLNIQVLNVAGERERESPGIGAWVEAFLAPVFCITQRPASGA